jgi:hypothetical protein
MSHLVNSKVLSRAKPENYPIVLLEVTTQLMLQQSLREPKVDKNALPYLLGG